MGEAGLHRKRAACVMRTGHARSSKLTLLHRLLHSFDTCDACTCMYVCGVCVGGCVRVIVLGTPPCSMTPIHIRGGRSPSTNTPQTPSLQHSQRQQNTHTPLARTPTYSSKVWDRQHPKYVHTKLAAQLAERVRGYGRHVRCVAAAALAPTTTQTYGHRAPSTHSLSIGLCGGKPRARTITYCHTSI